MTKTVTLTAGHSNTDPGAVNGSDREADLAQDMRNIVASILRNDYGLTVKTDGEGKGNLPLREAVKLIRGHRGLEYRQKQTMVSGIEPRRGRCNRMEAARRGGL